MSESLLKPRICFGQDALSVLNELSARSVLLVTDQAMVKFGLAERRHRPAAPARDRLADVGRRGGGSGYRHRGARHEADG